MPEPRQPEDHLPTRAKRMEAELESDELLADLPESVRPPHRLRIRQQNSAIALAFRMEEMYEQTAKAPLEKQSVEELTALAAKRGLEHAADATHEDLVALLTPADYETMGKPHLEALVAERGLEAPSKAKKEDLVALLEENDPNFEYDMKDYLELMRFAEEIDDWAEENIARDREEYAKWAEGKKHDVFFALLTRYASALGK